MSISKTSFKKQSGVTGEQAVKLLNKALGEEGISPENGNQYKAIESLVAKHQRVLREYFEVEVYMPKNKLIWLMLNAYNE